MEVTFSMQRLGRIEAECQHYMSEIQRMHRQRQEQRENEVNGRNSHRFFFFFFRAWIWWKCASRTHWLAKEKKYVKRHKEHVFLFTHGLDVSLFHYWFNSNRSRSAKNYFQNESIFFFFFLSSLAPSLKPQNVEVLESLTTTLCIAIGHGTKF